MLWVSKQGPSRIRCGAALPRLPALTVRRASPQICAAENKVSDEFTVPLCRDHHRELHRNGNEMAWWANVQVAPIEAAKDFWDATLSEQSNVQPK